MERMERERQVTLALANIRKATADLIEAGNILKEVNEYERLYKLQICHELLAREIPQLDRIAVTVDEVLEKVIKL